MIKRFLIIYFIFSSIYLFAEENIPDIMLPKEDVKIEDLKVFDVEIKLSDTALPEIKTESIPKPDITENIKIDLEKTLPEKIESPEKQKPIDAQILFGYGLNNHLLADFSIFVRNLNPLISIRYLRDARETQWFDRKDQKIPTSLDDLNAELLYSYKNFSIGTELGYFAHSYGLQDKSSYADFTKRILTIDTGPSLKFNFQNDITLRLLNSFLFTETSGENDNDDVIKRSDFDYLLDADLIYSQVFGSNHFFKAHAGYNFNYLDSFRDGDGRLFNDLYVNYFYNGIKAGINYSTLLADSFLIKASADFLGLFRDKEFFWYLLPYGKFGYNFRDYFQTYIEGGGKLNKNPDQFWYKENDYVIYPVGITPGYHWFTKTGLKGSYTGWISAHTDFEFAYNMDGFNWEYSDKEEKLYTLVKRSFYEINLEAGITFNFKEFLEINIEWIHYFYEKTSFTGQDNLLAKVTWGVPKIGLSFFVEFDGRFYRVDIDGDLLGNIYLLNAGLDWTWQKRIGAGAKFTNIIYIANYQKMAGYDLPGFEFIAYLKIGF